MRVLCLASEILGNRTFSTHLIESLARVPGVELEVVRLHPEDFERFGVPAWSRTSEPLRSRLVLRRKLAGRSPHEFDALFLEFWEAALVLPDWSRVLPTALAMDLLPTVARELSLRRSLPLPRRLLKEAAWAVHHRAFAAVLPDVDVFAPICHWVADALERDYGVRANRAHVTYVPIDLERWRPVPRVRGERPRLLFVGNDFRRKGGELLFEAYRRHLADVATLVVASNDGVLERLTPPAGVTVLRGRSRDDLLDEYRRADLFVFPTRADILPNVLAEALATALPCVATDVGGISDLVRPGETGELLPHDAGADEWGRRVRELLADPARLKRLGAGARRLAEERLGLPRFDRVIGETVGQLREGKRRVARDHATGRATRDRSLGAARAPAPSP